MEAWALKNNIKKWNPFELCVYRRMLKIIMNKAGVRHVIKGKEVFLKVKKRKLENLGPVMREISYFN